LTPTHTPTRSSRIREQLGHPVVDGDGHLLEVLPAFADFVAAHDRGDLIHSAPIFQMGPDYYRARRTTPVDERRRRRMIPGAWSTPGDTEYFATVSIPSRYYERLGEAGIDFSVLYPTLGLHLGQLADEDQRVALSRLYNEYMADQYRPYADRFTIAAVIPMHTPDEAIASLTHACALGAKVAMIPSYVRRPLPGETFTGQERAEFGSGGWLDTYGLDSLHDYDPVWSKAIELGLPLAAHSGGMGFSDRTSVSNYTYNATGHFAAAGEALAKSLFLGGVTYRFPRLRVALLEGGVVAGVRIFVDMVARWRKRGGHAIDRLSPANLDPVLFSQRLAESSPQFARYSAEEIIAVWGSPEDRYDDFAAAAIESEEDIRDRFCANFYWGCEADDPLVGLAFDARFTEDNGRVMAMMGSDLGHWDVPTFDAPLADAYELCERDILSRDDLRDFVFTHPVRCYASLNPAFFAGTTIERQAADAIQEVARA
jgi:predicted TIM-barrel fold metal-dependent hydrolase